MKTIAEVKAAILAKIAQSNLDAKDAALLKFQPVTPERAKDLDLPAAVPGFTLPYFDLHGKQTAFWRLRYLQDTRKGFDLLSGRKALRYVQPAGSLNEIYLPPYVDWHELSTRTEVPLVITEGELKAACATKAGLPTIGLGGVYSFKSTKNGMSLLPMLRKFKWKDRKVIICYDSDAVTNLNVITAENQLAKTLLGEGAEVHVLRLPPTADGGKVGLDDYLVAQGIPAFMELLEKLKPFVESAALHGLSEEVVYIRDPGFVYEYATGMKINPRDFTAHSYSHYWYETREETKEGPKLIQHPTALKWLQWKARPELGKITFAPGQGTVTDGNLNMWKGWPLEPKKGSVKLWHDLLDHLFTDTDPALRKWFEQWCAYPLQNPGGKMASAVLFWGRIHGSGKTLVGHTLMRIYGDDYSTEVKDQDLEDPRFEWAENKQFVLADDITGQDNRKFKRRLMTMVTQKTIRLNPKFVRSYTIPDCINYYFTSNDPDAFYMDDGDRRFFIHEVRAGKVPEALRVPYVAWRDSNEGAAALFHYLLSLDLTGFDPQAQAMWSEAKSEMVAVTKSDVASWVADLRLNPDLRIKLPGDLFTAQELLAMYDPSGIGKVSANGVARELKRAGFRAPGTTSATVSTKLGNVRLYAVRNVEKWSAASTKEIVAHYEKSRGGPVPGKKF